MEIKHLKTFLTLSELKSFTKTAAQLHYAQSYVSAIIRQLEEELQTPLFERIGKQVSLTAVGKTLIPYAREVLALTTKIEKQFIPQQHGKIVIGAAESICIHRLPAIISTFKREYPDVELVVKIVDTPDFRNQLADNTIDLALIADQPIYDAMYCVEVVAKEAICLFSVPDFPLAKEPTVAIDDFSDSPMLLTNKDCSYRKAFDKELEKAQVMPRIVFETSSVQAIKETVLSGLGIGLLPRFTIEKELENGELALINYETDYQINSQLIIHKDKWQSDYLKRLIEITLKRPFG